MSAETSGSVADEFGQVTYQVAPDRWLTQAEELRASGFAFFDFLTAVVEGTGTGSDTGIGLMLGVRKLTEGETGGAESVLVRTVVRADEPARTLAGVWAGASWPEREVAEMFGVQFVDADGQPMQRDPLLLNGAVDPPLLKSQWLRARQDTPWPGVKDPTDGSARPRRRTLKPPGTPEESR